MKTSRLYGMRRRLYLVLGLLSLAAGIIGIFVPIWPTTCFLLLATACFSRSSERLLAWMNTNRWFGTYLRRYRESGCIDRRIRNASLAFLWSGLAVSALLLGMNGWVILLLAAIGSAVSLHLLRLPIQA
jgi:uncharacterized membrane protein YbaN (DUF454 family)